MFGISTFLMVEFLLNVSAALLLSAFKLMYEAILILLFCVRMKYYRHNIYYIISKYNRSLIKIHNYFGTVFISVKYLYHVSISFPESINGPFNTFS